jgi:predicted esterase
MSPQGPQLWGGLNVARLSDMSEDERGGSAVVVLHGWGAPGDDLVPLAEALARPGVRFFVPAAPLPEMGGGRAWWHLDPNTPRPMNRPAASSLPRRWSRRARPCRA